jgi:gamma-glutamyltranspeptidase/glutathione hydrolase
MIRSVPTGARTEVVAERGVATGGHEKEAEAGVRILQQGGNAVDAVVAAAFTGFVVEPSSCGLGGYGRMSLFLAERREFVTIDAYVRAPQKSRPDMFEIDSSVPYLYYGHPQTVGGKSQRGYLAAAVPGAVAGLCAAHEMFGRLRLAQVLEPAIEAAEAGLPVSWSLALMIRDRLEVIRELPHTAALLLRNGDPPRAANPWQAGDRLDMTDLARTLRLIGEQGPAAFYAGPVAEAIEREFASGGGILTAADLAAYRPKIMRENPARYRDHDYISAYDQVAYEALNILDQFDLRALGPDSVEFRHLAAEAVGHAFVDNMVHYGDPDFARSPVNGLASRAFAVERARGIRPDRAAPRPILAGNPWPYEAAADAPEVLPAEPTIAQLAGTTQMAAADQAGNLVTLITSLTGSFGSMVLVPGTGVILNNSMQNFDPRPEHPNCIQPGKMPIFAAPPIVASRDGQAVFGGCGSGGYRIETGVLHAMMYALDFGLTAQPAVDGLRVHCQGQATYVDSRLPAEVQARLAEMGHEVVPLTEEPNATNFGRINAITRDPKTGVMRTGTGPAWSTAAAGY